MRTNLNTITFLCFQSETQNLEATQAISFNNVSRNMTLQFITAPKFANS